MLFILTKQQIGTILPCRLDHVIMSETLARLLVQTCRVRGLSAVLADLLTFQGSELYFSHHFPPEFDGLAFGALQERVHDAIACGFARGEKVFLNPSTDQVLNAATDRLLVLSESGTSWRVGPPRPMKSVEKPFRLSKKTKREVVCIIGTNSMLDFILKVSSFCFCFFVLTAKKMDRSLIAMSQRAARFICSEAARRISISSAQKS